MAASLEITTPLQDEQARALEEAAGTFPSTWRLSVTSHAIGAFRLEVRGPGYRTTSTFDQDCSGFALSGYLKAVERYARTL